MSTFCNRGSSNHPLQQRIDKADPDGEYWQKRADRVLAALASRMNYLAYVGFAKTVSCKDTWRQACEAAEAKLQELQEMGQ